MRIEVGTIKSTIITDNPKLLSDLVKIYTIPIPQARYSGGNFWNSHKKYITEKGKFKSGLLNRILGTLKKAGCTPEVHYLDKLITEVEPASFTEFTPYEHQTTLIKAALKEGRCIVKSPTGSGKTLILATIVKSITTVTKKMVILVNEKQVAVQNYEYLKKLNIPSLGICFGGNYIYGDIIVCTIQSIDKILDTHLDAEALFVDEVHQIANGKVSLAAMESFPNAKYRFGFTATVPTDKIRLYNLEGRLGPVITSDSSKELVDKNILAKPIIQITPILYPEHYWDSKETYMWFYDKFIINNKVRNDKIKELIDIIRSKNDKAKILILVKNLEHGRILEELIPDNVFLQGSDDLQGRNKVIKKFVEHDGVSILTGTKILQTGINIPQITHYINAAGYKSEIATLQSLGRALRVHEGKNKVYVYDFSDNTLYLGGHSTKRARYYKKEGYEIKTLPSIKYEDT